MGKKIDIYTVILLLILVVVFAGDHISRKIALQHFNPIYEGALAATIGSLTLLFFNFKSEKKLFHKGFIKLIPKHFISGLIFSAINIVGLCGLHLTGANHASILIFTFPIFVTMLHRYIYKEYLNVNKK